MKLKVKLDKNYKVEDIERDDKSPSWVEKHPQKSPPIPKWMYQILNIRDEKGYSSLHQSQEDLLVSNKLEVIPVSGQQWQAMNTNQRNELLELVEFTGQDAGDYCRLFQSMYPKTPRGKE